MSTNSWLIPAGVIKVSVPDTAQETDTTCGASALQAVCLYFRVGPKKEKQIAKAMHMSMKNGSDPEDILRAVLLFGLHHESVQPMSLERLLEYLDHSIPVLVMLQAWATKKNIDYSTDWKDGHWVVAIGYDTSGVYFEDPSIDGYRGFLTYQELKTRWHDIGKDEQPVPRYGIALWKPGATPHSRKVKRAVHID